MVFETFLTAAQAREIEAVKAMAERDYAEAARCYVWAKEAYARCPGFEANFREMESKAASAIYLRNKEAGQ
jgi:hypothetical protein